LKVFDVYEGTNLGEGKKSYALVLLFKDNNKTLTDTKLINYGKFYKKL
jgi:phenylalanyl-tRNA synthetase beta chain